MNFDRANTEVTRKSFGSKVDKTFQREGVIPVRDRGNKKPDYAAESAKYNDLNKKVESRKLNDIKEQKAFNDALNKGYQEVREFLIRDIMSEICVESLLVDKDDVYNNLKNITNLVNEHVDNIGGFNGFKEIAESTNNQLLKNIVSTCEEMCLIVGERNLLEAAGNVSKLDFELNKEEMDEFDYRKKSFGSETIINAVRDKVLDVVKYEQEANASKQEVMDEIQMKVEELGAPVGEAMEFIFNQKIEETTLFDSLMRKNYKNLLESESSFIFESGNVCEDDCEYEDEEFKMSDIELVDEEDDEDLKDMFMENMYHDIAGVMDESEEILESTLNSLLETIKPMLNCKSKSEAMRVKDDIRNLQVMVQEGKILDRIKKFIDDGNKKIYARRGIQPNNNLYAYDNKYGEPVSYAEYKKLVDVHKNYAKKIEGIVKSFGMKLIPEDKRVNEVVRKYKDNVAVKTIDYEFCVFEDNFDKLKSKFKELSKYDSYDDMIDNGGSIDDLLNNSLFSKIKSLGFEEESTYYLVHKSVDNLTVTYGHDGNSALSLYIIIPYIDEEGVQESSDSMDENIKQDPVDVPTKGKKKINEEVILCPECKKDPCVCKGVKESDDVITEGMLKNKIVKAYNNYKDKKLNKVDFEKLRDSMIQIAANARTIKELDVLDRDVDFSIAELEKMKKPENEEKITFHIEFLNKEYKKFLTEKRQEMEKQQCVESFLDKLDDYCSELNAIIEAHELAYGSALESLTYEINDNAVFVPFIQPNDCNLSNLEFAYKSKMVCESLKDALQESKNEHDFIIIEKAVQLNLQSINEAVGHLENIENMNYKKSVLQLCEGYLNKVQNYIDNNVAPNNPITESSSVFTDEEEVEKIFNAVKEYTLIESTNNKLMEVVMAESIVEYTILEAFNTLRLMKFEKDDVRRLSRKNLK